MSCRCNGVAYHANKYGHDVPGKCSLCEAAPELLEACKAANLRLLQQKSTVEDSDILDLLQAAIAKAEGR